MSSPFVSFALIMAVAAAAPYIASLVPGRAVPEVVFLVFAGALLGPNMAGVLSTSSFAISFLSDLGVAFLFLNAGYEIDPKDLGGRMGLHAILAWAVSLLLAILLTTTLMADRFTGQAGVAFAICLTTTAFGTLAPIMRDRHLMGTPVGRAVSVYGAYGELLPILAMALLMSTRSTRATIATLLIFVAICLAILAFPALLPRVRERIDSWLKENAWSGSRPLLRLSILLLSALVMACEVLDLEPVLGSFIAGFILGAFAPHDHVLEEKLQDIGNGFLVPAYFVISGAGVSLPAAFESVGLLFGFIGLLVLIRGGIVAVSLNINKETRGMRKREKYAVSAYCTMALPLVVAVTDVAVESGAMGTNTASILVSAGAITVLLIPIATSFVRVGAESDVFLAVHEVAAEKLPIQKVWKKHRALLQADEKRFAADVEEQKEHGHKLDSFEYLVTGASPTKSWKEDPQEKTE